MRRAAILCLLTLIGCVARAPGQTVMVDGVAMAVRQVDRGTTYGFVADAVGNYAIAPTGQGAFIAVAGAPDRDMAIRAFGAFCGVAVNPDDWDTDQVPVAPDTGEYQFGGTCG